MTATWPYSVPPPIRTLFAGKSIEPAFQLRDLLLQINACATTRRHTLCFGDCNIGNIPVRVAGIVAILPSTSANSPISSTEMPICRSGAVHYCGSNAASRGQIA